MASYGNMYFLMIFKKKKVYQPFTLAFRDSCLTIYPSIVLLLYSTHPFHLPASQGWSSFSWLQTIAPPSPKTTQVISVSTTAQTESLCKGARGRLYPHKLGEWNLLRRGHTFSKHIYIAGTSYRIDSKSILLWAFTVDVFVRHDKCVCVACRAADLCHTKGWI